MRLTVNPDQRVAIRVLRRAVELGVDHIDTAAFYFSPGGILDVGDGETRYATELIRDALSPYGDQVFVATKVGPGILPGGAWGQARTAGELRYQIEENLRRGPGKRNERREPARIGRRGCGGAARGFRASGAARLDTASRAARSRHSGHRE
jgi:hypothetical protein